MSFIKFLCYLPFILWWNLTEYLKFQWVRIRLIHGCIRCGRGWYSGLCKHCCAASAAREYLERYDR